MASTNCWLFISPYALAKEGCCENFNDKSLSTIEALFPSASACSANPFHQFTPCWSPALSKYATYKPVTLDSMFTSAIALADVTTRLKSSVMSMSSFFMDVSFLTLVSYLLLYCKDVTKK